MRLFSAIGVLGVVGAIAAAVFFFGGFYNIAATSPDLDVVAWSLVKVRNASIARHATDRAPANLGDPALVQAGAKAFAVRGCASCHGAPGVEWAKFSEAIRPDPPDLSDIVKEATPEEIFWVVKNGINMTGMPGFALVGADDKELWSIVAFVEKIASVSEADYKMWTSPPAPTASPAAPAPIAEPPPAPVAPSPQP